MTSFFKKEIKLLLNLPIEGVHNSIAFVECTATMDFRVLYLPPKANTRLKISHPKLSVLLSPQNSATRPLLFISTALPIVDGSREENRTT